MLKNKRFSLLVLVLLVLAPLTMADTGPKPGMQFTLDYEISPVPEIDYAELLECDLADCSDAVPLEEMGPQGVWCDDAEFCKSMAYGYNGEYFQLVLHFADGETLTSNVFAKEYFNTYYDVTVQADGLLVEQVGGSGQGPGCSLQL